ncbi:MAG: BamA/TamA family outer membrane protein [Candidatus Margulisiibacteriota bacterium]
MHIFRWTIAFLWMGIVSAPLMAAPTANVDLRTLLDTFSATTTNVAVTPNTIATADRILDVVVTGNNRLPSALIKNWITAAPGSAVNTGQITRDVRNVKQMGTIKEAAYTLEKTPDGQLLIITVVENPVISEVIFSGVTVYSVPVLMKVVEIQPGDILSVDQLRRSVDAINTQYANDGYLFAKVVEVSRPTADGQPLVFTVSEGTLEAVIVSGNTRTQDYVILREFEMEPGTPLQRDQVAAELRKVYNLNYFSNLEPLFLPGNRPGTEIIQLVVEEKPGGSVSFGGGYSPQAGTFLFSDLVMDNVFGTGQTVALKGQVGFTSDQSNNTNLEFRYHNPWMWPKRKAFTFRLWSRSGGFGGIGQTSNDFRYFNQVRTGASATVTIPFNYEFGMTHTVTGEVVRPAVSTGRSPYSIQSYQPGLFIDTRDFRFNPTRGGYYSFTVDNGFGIYGGSLIFTQYDLDLRHFIPLAEKQVLATRALFGWRNGMSELTDAYWVGGSSTVRGYQDYAPFGQGNRMALFNVEYRYLFTDSFDGIVFVDTGLATNGSLFNIGNYRWGKGFGIRLQSPFGFLRLDISFGDLDPGPIFHVNIGHMF